MAFTLFDLMLGASEKMGIARVSNSTGGTTTTIIDTSLSNQTADDDFNNGTLFIIASTGASVSITGQFRKISDYVAGTGTFTLGSTIASSGPDPTMYAYTTPEFSNELLVEKANAALRSLGPLVFVDKDTITSSAAQTDYASELAWKYSPPLRIDLQTAIGSSATRNDWATLDDWHYQPSSAGATGLLIFGTILPSGRKVRVWYEAVHHRIAASTQAVDERINPELAILALVEKLYEYRNSLNRGSVDFDLQRWNDAKMQFQAAKAAFPIWRPRRRRQLNIVGDAEPDHLPYPPPYGPA